MALTKKSCMCHFLVPARCRVEMFRGDSKMKASFVLTFAASMLVVRICTIPADAQTYFPVSLTDTDSVPPQTSTFVALARITGNFIEAADRLALARSRNPRIRRFAQESILKENRTSNTITDLAGFDHDLQTGRSASGPKVSGAGGDGTVSDSSAGGDGTVSDSSAMLNELVSLSQCCLSASPDYCTSTSASNIPHLCAEWGQYTYARHG